LDYEDVFRLEVLNDDVMQLRVRLTSRRETKMIPEPNDDVIYWTYQWSMRSLSFFSSSEVSNVDKTAHTCGWRFIVVHTGQFDRWCVVTEMNRV